MIFGFGREGSSLKQIEYIPFKTIFGYMFFQYGFYNFFINIVCNIVLFIPYGLLGFVFPRLVSIKLNLIYFLFPLLIIEFIQYISGRGTADIDDVILNSLGVVIGNLLYNSKYIQAIVVGVSKAK